MTRKSVGRFVLLSSLCNGDCSPTIALSRISVRHPRPRAPGDLALRSVVRRRSFRGSGLVAIPNFAMVGEMIIPKTRAAEDRRTVSGSERGSFRSRVPLTSQDLVP
jgi:hypothetical protein